MLSRSVPIDANQRDSARVEKRGPLTTVTVPPSSTVTPSARQAASASARRWSQYGSASAAWYVVGPSKNVPSRPAVRSTSWSGITNVVGPRSARSDPTAQGATTWRTPSECSAQTLARYGTRWGGCS